MVNSHSDPLTTTSETDLHGSIQTYSEKSEDKNQACYNLIKETTTNSKQPSAEQASKDECEGPSLIYTNLPKDEKHEEESINKKTSSKASLKKDSINNTVAENCD